METGGNMKVVHLCSSDSWEQGMLAYRIHKGVMEKGIDSLFVTIFKSSGDPSVKVIVQDPVFKDKVKLMEKVPRSRPEFIAKIFQDWRNKLGIPIMPAEGDSVFGLTDSSLNLEQIQEIKEADIIHLHWIPGMLNFELAPLFFLGKPVIITLYDMFYVTGGCYYPMECKGYKEGCLECPIVNQEAQKIVKQALELKKKVYNLLNLKVVAQSRCLKQKVEGTGVFKEVDLIYPGVPTEIYPVLNKQRAREILGIEPNTNVLLFVTSSVASKRKGIFEFLEAFEKIVKEDLIENPYFVLIGADSGEIEGKYFTLSYKNKYMAFHIVPFVPTEEVLSWYYSAADVFVSPSIEEYVSLYPLDAMAMGLPIVGFKNTSLEDLINHGQNGYLAQNKNIEDLIKGIQFVLNENKSNMKRKSKNIIRERFLWDLQIQKYIELYKSSIEDKNKVKINEMIKFGEEMFLNNKKYMAREIFERLLTFDKNNAYLLNNIGVIYWEEHRYKKAMEYFKRAYDIDPNNEEIRENYNMAINEFK